MAEQSSYQLPFAPYAPPVSGPWQARWIWSAEAIAAGYGPEDLTQPDAWIRNCHVRFRKTFSWDHGDTLLHITADSRYTLFINGEYVGQGPMRSWPTHYAYDTYDITAHLRPGSNTIAVLVTHFGEGTFQYIPGPPGLLAQANQGEQVLFATDESWPCSPEPAVERNVARVCVQLPYEEQFDARRYDGWLTPEYDDASWNAAVPVDQGSKGLLEPRDLPFLTLEPISPHRFLEVAAVRPAAYQWTLYAKPYLAPLDRTSNMVYAHAYFGTQVHAPQECMVTLRGTHANWRQVKVNGELVSGTPRKLYLKAGWNSLLIEFRGKYHLPQLAVAFDSNVPLKFAYQGPKGGAPWALFGPYELGPTDQQQVDTDKDETLIACSPGRYGAQANPLATASAGERLWERGLVDEEALQDHPVTPMGPEETIGASSGLACHSDQVLSTAHVGEGSPLANLVTNPEALISGSDWCVIQPSPDGSDIRLLVDYGKEWVGFQRFEVEAAEGTIIDWHGFEFIQPDGRRNLADGMNNSFRYVCREGCQAYRTLQRRGYQYVYITLRNMAGPVRLRRVQMVANTYPQQRRGAFTCSDPLLNQIWEVGAHTLRCSAEDTYVDCPTYEQTHWVGDARNEALVDWVVNGDHRLWYHCLLQAARSLQRSDLVESHVPSAWQNILPAWSFLWMRSCREYYLFTGDRTGSTHLLSWVKRNVDGIARHIDSRGLFSIRAWNMFDWADMDTPTRGVVTHQNCLAVLALRDVAQLAQWLGENDLAASWNALADGLQEAINRHLWNDSMQAYTDCLHGDAHSKVYSQQTQTAAYIADVAQGERAERTREILFSPPEGFVKAGSPFFAFFLLEALQREGDDQALLDRIRHDWGFMVEQGATTFWEMWSLRGGRLTRSHCHGWSAAPTFFLSTYVLGVMPSDPEGREVVVAPHPGDLRWCRGRVPTAWGDVEVQWENPLEGPFRLLVKAPVGVRVIAKPPRPNAEVELG